jgi:hypothetical protein
MSEKRVIINNSENIDSIEFNYNRTINIYSNNRKQCKSVSIDSPDESFEVIINRPKDNDTCILITLLIALISVFIADLTTHVN